MWTYGKSIGLKGTRRCVKLDERELLKVVGRIIGEDRVLDDCAVIPWKGELLVATTDMLHRTTDFPAGMTPWQIGWHAAAVTLSDIAAMAADPLFLLLSAGLEDPGDLEGILLGAKACCRKYACPLVGGDLDAHQELTLVSSAVGTVHEDRLVRRRGARPGDLVVLTGTPGRAIAGLEGYPEYREFLLLPQPRISEGKELSALGATSMMDTSDGLVLSLFDLLEANSCGFEIFQGQLPLPPGVPATEALEFALYGGGDYELLATVPQEACPGLPFWIQIIGRVVREPVVRLGDIVLQKRGYIHSWGKSP